MKQGLQRFILDTVAPLTTAVGDAWMRGEFAVFEEHLYTEQVQSMLRNANAGVQPQGQAPRVLLTSFPNEPHSLGLLMVEAMLTVEGASCIPLGTETPIPEIARAAAAHRAEIVGVVLDKVAHITIPKLFIHSPTDEIVPYSQGRALFERAAEPKEFLEIRGGHNEAFLISGDGYISGLDRFLGRHLGQGS